MIITSRISNLILLLVLSVATHNCIGMDYREEKDHSIAEVERVPVGDINISYKVLGQGDPIVLIMGSGSTMDMWDPLFLDNLSSKYKVIVFDNRGMGNTTAPPGNFSIAEFANDTAGLMEALGIEKAHIMGWSMGSFVAQELAIRYPEKVNKIILYAGDCGGKEAVMPSPQVLKDLTNTSGSPEERGMRLFNLLFPKDWLSRQPAFYKWFPIPKETSLPENIERQTQAIADVARQLRPARLDRVARPCSHRHGGCHSTSRECVYSGPKYKRLLAGSVRRGRPRPDVSVS